MADIQRCGLRPVPRAGTGARGVASAPTGRVQLFGAVSSADLSPHAQTYHDVKKSPYPLSREQYLSELRAEAGSDGALAAELVAFYPPDPRPLVDQKPRKGWYLSDRMSPPSG